MEPNDRDSSESKLPLHEDVMQLARLGEIGPIQKLFEEGKYKANHTDAENITPLHWAAINNHYALCQYLIDQGADVNAVGGESEATPAQWAVQRCHYYTVSLLLRHGADPTIADAGGYKMIHLATFDGNAFMLLIILLHPNVAVDEPDAQGHTALMWAAYSQLPAIVELLIRFGASISATDETAFTPLHWALVSGSGPCILRLLENGADRFALTSSDKSPAVVAEEMKTTRAWHQALNESGFNDDATPKRLPIPHTSFVRNRGLETLPPPAESNCNLLSEELCSLVLRDPFTVVLAAWCTLQFTWMVMLFIVQAVQIARAMTTYESMGGHKHRGSPASQAITSAITAGTTSLSGASLTDAGMGPDPVVAAGSSDRAHFRKEGFFAQWKKLLGLDTFIATATGRSGRRKRGNPFSRGVITNCKDFWGDPAPYFGQRENGAAMLNGEVINYTRLYETPSKLTMRRTGPQQEHGLYHSVATEDAV
ncbi:MAG: hypothetical protein LQ348_001704 [Seirophora lacunosa]|nr:MAG: hypothetical protein LQ348_001704 [Seirophora lacunosa]